MSTSEHVNSNNIERFTGFANLYDRNRPSPPQEVIKILHTYLGEKPRNVVDIGCGTGLSSFLWMNDSVNIIGVEPNDDMRKVAITNWERINKPSNIHFTKGLSHQLELASESIDIITCSQSFHWMEPQSTLHECARVLRSGGIFAAYDSDWPPTFNWIVEEQYKKLINLAETRARQLADVEKHPHKWNKEKHLQQIEESGLFRFSKEIVFHNWELCNADRYANIALSQGGLQTALKKGANELHKEVEHFKNNVTEAFAGKAQNVLFSYRMRLGIK